MKKCQFCAEDIQDEAIVCRYCGKDLIPTEDKKPDDIKKISGTGAIVAVAVMITLLCAVIFIIAVTQGDDEKPKVSHDRVGAWVVCNNFVKKQLKSPSSAKFPAGYSQFTQDLGGGRYKIDAYVDSENAFGAMIRTEFICIVDHHFEDTYKLEELTFSD